MRQDCEIAVYDLIWRRRKQYGAEHVTAGSNVVNRIDHFCAVGGLMELLCFNYFDPNMYVQSLLPGKREAVTAFLSGLESTMS